MVALPTARPIYPSCEQMRMGAREALQLLQVLRRHDAASRRTVREYVLPALYAGAELTLDSDEYAAAEDALYDELAADGSNGEDRLSAEATLYLGELQPDPWDGLEVPDARVQASSRLTGTRAGQAAGIRATARASLNGDAVSSAYSVWRLTKTQSAPGE